MNIIEFGSGDNVNHHPNVHAADTEMPPAGSPGRVEVGSSDIAALQLGFSTLTIGLDVPHAAPLMDAVRNRFKLESVHAVFGDEAGIFFQHWNSRLEEFANLLGDDGIEAFASPHIAPGIESSAQGFTLYPLDCNGDQIDNRKKTSLAGVKVGSERFIFLDARGNGISDPRKAAAIYYMNDDKDTKAAELYFRPALSQGSQPDA